MTGPVATPLAVTALITALLILVEHYTGLWLWQNAFRQPMPNLVRYSLGTLAIIGPLCGLLLYLDGARAWATVLSVLVITAAAGAATAISYGLDWAVDQLIQFYERKRLALKR